MKKKKINRSALSVVIFLLAVILVLAVTAVIQTAGNKATIHLSREEAQAFIDEKLSSLPNAVANGAKYIVGSTKVTVNDVSYGNEKNTILNCTYSTVDVGTTIATNADKYALGAYELYLANKAENKMTNSAKVRQALIADLSEDLESAKTLSGEVTLEMFELNNGELELYLSDDAVNTVFGGLLDAKELIENINEVEYKGETVSIDKINTLRTGIKECFALRNYNSERPDTAIGIRKGWHKFLKDFDENFIVKQRWRYLTDGFVNTIKITFLAVLMGIVLGFIVAVIRVINQKTGQFSLLSGFCQIYLAVARGTPLMVQLLIFYFVILLPLGVDFLTASVLCFGFNSGAYVSEIVRGGLMSIDEGQTEAGRSLGFTYIQTMFHIIIPQAFKAVLPSLANEFISLLKETSVAFTIGVADLTQGGMKIRSITYSNYMPLISVAIIYLVVVLGLSKCVSILERRLHKGDNR